MLPSPQQDSPAGNSSHGGVDCEPGPPTGGVFRRLTTLLSDLVSKLDGGAQASHTTLEGSAFSGFHDISASEVDCALTEGQLDPLDRLTVPDQAPDPLDEPVV